MRRHILSLLAALTLNCCTSLIAQTIIVGSYNIRYRNDEDSLRGHIWQRRCQVISDLINWERPIVWGAQEVLHSQLLDLMQHLDGYGYIGVGRDDGRTKGEYAAIFYRTDDVELIDNGHFWLNEQPDRPVKGWDAACVRICTWGHFKVRATGQEFLFFNLHMDHVGTVARRESAQLVMQRISEMATRQQDGKPLPTILTGDFNVDQQDEIYSIFTSSGLLKDTYEAARLRFAENGTFHGYHPERHTASRIDHIFVTLDVAVDAYAARTDAYWTPQDDGQHSLRHPSDHYPIFARITLRSND